MSLKKIKTNGSEINRPSNFENAEDKPLQSEEKVAFSVGFRPDIFLSSNEMAVMALDSAIAQEQKSQSE